MTLVYQFIMKINFINIILVIGFIICQTYFCVNILFIEKFPKDLKLVQTFSLDKPNITHENKDKKR